MGQGPESLLETFLLHLNKSKFYYGIWISIIIKVLGSTTRTCAPSPLDFLVSVKIDAIHKQDKEGKHQSSK